jgi:lipopolysaccharide export system protein LptA
MRRVLLLAASGLLASAGGAAGQGVACNIQYVPGGEANISNAGTPTESGIVFRAHFICDAGRRSIRADTATYSVASGHIELFGRVQVRDPERTLTAARATYLTRLRQLSASGNVVVTDGGTGSVIQGDLLNYLEQTPQRASQITATATTGLARAVLLAQRAAEPAATDTTVVDAMQIHVEGEDLFRGIGNAVLTRDSLRATGHIIEYRREPGGLEVLGGGRVHLPGAEMQGDSITASLGPDDEIRDVLARHGAVVNAEDMRVTAPAVRLFFEAGEVVRLVAMDWPAMAGASRARPRAEAEDFRMEADSLDVLAPAQRLQEAVAIGGAWVEHVTPDSLKALLPDAGPEVLALISTDWMRGDTVRAYFADGPAGVAEGAAEPAAARVMERLTAAGEPAQVMHRTRNENADPEARLSIAYLVGRRVEVTFVDGEVAVVTASEDVRGVYLQPGDAARRTGAAGGGAGAAVPPRQP